MPGGGAGGSDRGWVSRACPSQQPDSVGVLRGDGGVPGSLCCSDVPAFGKPDGSYLPVLSAGAGFAEEMLPPQCPVPLPLARRVSEI